MSFIFSVNRRDDGTPTLVMRRPDMRYLVFGNDVQLTEAEVCEIFDMTDISPRAREDTVHEFIRTED